MRPDHAIISFDYFSLFCSNLLIFRQAMDSLNSFSFLPQNSSKIPPNYIQTDSYVYVFVVFMPSGDDDGGDDNNVKGNKQ